MLPSSVSTSRAQKTLVPFRGCLAAQNRWILQNTGGPQCFDIRRNAGSIFYYSFAYSSWKGFGSVTTDSFIKAYNPAPAPSNKTLWIHGESSWRETQGEDETANPSAPSSGSEELAVPTSLPTAVLLGAGPPACSAVCFHHRGTHLTGGLGSLGSEPEKFHGLWWSTPLGALQKWSKAGWCPRQTAWGSWKLEQNLGSSINASWPNESLAMHKLLRFVLKYDKQMSKTEEVSRCH